MQNRLYITVPVKHANNLHRTRPTLVDDQIGKDRPKSDRSVGQVGSRVADARSGRDQRDAFPESPKNVASHANSAFVDQIRLDLIKIAHCFR